MKMLNNIFKIVPPEYSGRLRFIMVLSVINLVLDFISIILLVPVFANLLNPDAIFGNVSFTFYSDFFAHNRLGLVLGVLAFFIIKNFLFIKTTKHQSDFCFSVSNALSVNLLRNYFGKTLTVVKAEKNSALVKDIIFIPNNFVIYVLTSVIQLISETLLLVLILLAAFCIHTLAAIFLAVMAGLIITAVYFYNKGRLTILNDRFTEMYNRNFSHLMNAVNGYGEIKTNQAEEFFLDKFSDSNSGLNEMHSKLTTDRLIKPKYTETLLVAIITGLFLFSEYFPSNRGTNVLFISFLFAASIKIIPSVNRILIGLTNLKSHRYTIDILKESRKPESDRTDASVKPVIFQEKIELKNISFTFGESEPVLNNVSIVIPKGKIIGIIGDSGNGKSTLANIVATLIVPDSGNIYCDGKIISELQKKTYLKLISYVPQSPFVLEGSIRENLVLNDVAITPDILDPYLDAFRIKGLIDSLPHKLNTFIGSNGYALSGGQLQRLAIIRALLRNPQLLILDEATNQLNPDLRNTVMAFIKNISAEKHLTIVNISHNKKELDAFCDSVYELKKGTLIPL